jgi:hypothetical protein
LGWDLGGGKDDDTRARERQFAFNAGGTLTFEFASIHQTNIGNSKLS